ncbi:hypothetical protein KJI32_002416 [Escherichia coli]|nr:hypothetical protein [Escherichia coli]EHP6137841.1 hypothetical protein [Escherichia coli]
MTGVAVRFLRTFLIINLRIFLRTFLCISGGVFAQFNVPPSRVITDIVLTAPVLKLYAGFDMFASKCLLQLFPVQLCHVTF